MSPSDDASLFLRSGISLTEPQRLTWPPPWAGHIPFAFWVMENVRPHLLVELGTHTGNSYCAFLQSAVLCNLPLKAYAIDTWEGDLQAGYYGNEIYDELSAYHDPLYGGISRLLRMTFNQALDYFSDGSIDLLHIDGLHTYDAVKDDFTSWLPKMSKCGVILMHDINVREHDFGVWKLWEEVSVRYPAVAFDHSNGLGVLYVGTEPMADGLRWLMVELNGSPEGLMTVRRFFARLGMGLCDRLWSQERARLLVKSEQEHARLLAEAEQEHARLLTEAEQERARLLAEAEQERARLLAESGQERTRLLAEFAREHARLRAEFEREHARLRGKFEQEHARLRAESEADNRRLQDMIMARDEQLAALYASSSWRATAGLRWGIARVKQWGARGRS